MRTMELTCICCPVGCVLRAEIEGGEVRSVQGNTCKRGADYARQECIAPVRVVTGSVALRGGMLPRISVKTDVPVPKDRCFAVMEAVHALSVCAPVRIGDVLLENIAGTGARLIATRSGDAQGTLSPKTPA